MQETLWEGLEELSFCCFVLGNQRSQCEGLEEGKGIVRWGGEGQRLDHAGPQGRGKTQVHCWAVGGKGGKMGGLVSGYPTNMCKSPVRVYAAPQPSTQGQMWIAQGPPLVGIHLSLAVPVPPGQEQEPHLSLCITDGLEVRQSALWGRAGQVAKKTRACQQ